MRRETLKKIRALDAATAEAGGYVLSPSEVRVSKKAEREFTAMRHYSLEHKKPISQFTDADYRALGIKRPKLAL